MKRTVAFLGIFIFSCILSFPVMVSGEEENPAVEELLIGLVPEQNIFKQMNRYKPLAEYVSQNLGITLRLTILSKYGDVIDRFNTRGMDGAFFGDLTTVIAYEKLGVIPVVRIVNSDGSDFVRGHIIVRNDGMINSVKDMRERIIAFVDRASVAGYLFPVAFFKKQGINRVENFFVETFYTGSHDASVYAVLDGRADVGCVNDTVFKRLIKSDPIIQKELKIIATSPKMPNVSLCLRKDISPLIRKKLVSMLLDIGKNSDGQEVLKKMETRGFKRADIEDFMPVYKLIHEIGTTIENYKYRIE